MAFQEDDALVNMFLNYPNPIDNWQLWSTISTFTMKLFTSISGTAVALHRGTTNYPVENLPRKSKTSVKFDQKQFLHDVNHPAPFKPARALSSCKLEKSSQKLPEFTPKSSIKLCQKFAIRFCECQAVSYGAWHR